MNVVIDTNVLIAANGLSEQVKGDNQLICINFLEDVKNHKGCVSVDSLNLIFDEYSNYCNHKGQPGVGDAFFKWLFDNQGYETLCEKVMITLDNERGLTEFPDDINLKGFDKSDRKFVAVALNSQFNPLIYNATDSDWKIFNNLLLSHGVIINQLCPSLLSQYEEIEITPNKSTSSTDKF